VILKHSFFVASTMAVLALVAPAAAQEAQPPVLQVGTLPDALTLDGVLNEPAWMSAPLTDAFTQSEPAEGSMPSARTTVRVLAGPKALAIGVVCDDPAPNDIVSFSVRRDAPLGNEDHVRIVLGPFLDGRSGYVFAVNPSGARYDGLINPGGDNDNADWDGIWEAAASRTPTGWSAEIRIPTQTLSFKAWPARVAFQCAAPDSALARNGSVGVPCAPVPNYANESCGSGERTACLQPGSRSEREAGNDRRRWHSNTVGRSRCGRATQPRRHTAVGNGSSCLAHRQH
jgi:hypothetical protein